MKPPLTHPNTLILDACVLINLYASLREQEILETLGVAQIVVGQKVEGESLFFHTGPHGDEQSQKSPIELQPLVDAGLLQIVDLETESERNRFIALASTLDDGEAHQLAIALERRFVVATDEQRALRVLHKEAPELPSFTTVDLLHHWATQRKIEDAIIREVIYNIRKRARFQPRGTAPLYSWWHDYAPI